MLGVEEFLVVGAVVWSGGRRLPGSVSRDTGVMGLDVGGGAWGAEGGWWVWGAG